jgi:hypothetical protein
MRYVAVVTGTLLLLMAAAATSAYQEPAGTTGTTSTTGTAGSAPPPPPPTPHPTGRYKGHKAAAHCTYKGTVASVDATGKSFVVHPAKGDDVTLKVNDKTKYGKSKTWDDVKADAKVSGTCKKDGADTWAVSVKFWPAPKAKAEPAAKSGKR